MVKLSWGPSVRGIIMVQTCWPLLYRHGLSLHAWADYSNIVLCAPGREFGPYSHSFKAGRKSNGQPDLFFKVDERMEKA